MAKTIEPFVVDSMVVGPEETEGIRDTVIRLRDSALDQNFVVEAMQLTILVAMLAQYKKRLEEE